MPLTIEGFEKLLKEDQKKRNIAQIKELSLDGQVVAAGENYTAALQRAYIRAELHNGKNMQTSLVVKEIPLVGPKVDFFQSHQLSQTEVKLYKEILPMLEDILQEQGLPPFWPRLVGEIDNYLVFSDLRNKNYKSVCRNERLDLYHSLLVMRCLAIFHAAGLVLINRGGLDKASFHPIIHLRDSSDMRKMNETCLMLLSEVILQEWGPEWRELGERLQKKASTISEELREMVQVDNNRLNVLCHGDLWSTNIMFKYSRGNHLPIGLKFIDFQLTHYNSYGYDLLYFLSTSVKLDLRRKQRRLLLEAYTTELRDTLDLYGLKDLAPTLGDVEKELERLKPWYMFTLCGIMPIATSTIEGAFTIEEFEGKNGPYNPDIFRRENYKEEVEQDILLWAEQGFI